MNRRISCFFISLFTLTLFISIIYADQVETFNVDAGFEKIFTLNLSEGMKVTGSLSITGGSGDDIGFWVTNPTGNKILDLGRVSQGTQFEFTASQDGAFSLHFDNTFSLLSTKNVVITYDASLPTILGIDPILLLVIFSVVLIVLVSALIIIRKLKKQKATKSEA